MKVLAAVLVILELVLAVAIAGVVPGPKPADLSVILLATNTIFLLLVLKRIRDQKKRACCT